MYLFADTQSSPGEHVGGEGSEPVVGAAGAAAAAAAEGSPGVRCPGATSGSLDFRQYQYPSSQ